MDDADLLLAALTGRTVTRDLVDEARRHLVMLRSLLQDVRDTAPALAAPVSSSWRSIAADRYAEGLSELHVTLLGARDSLEGAERSLDERIRRMERELATQGLPPAEAAAVAPVSPVPRGMR